MFKRLVEGLGGRYNALIPLIPYLCIIILYIVLYYQNENGGRAVVKDDSNMPAPIQTRSVLTWSTTKEVIDSLDPATADTDVERSLVNNLMEGLTRDVGDHLELAGATYVAIDDHAKKFTFKIRNAYWSNGQLVTAYDYEHAWTRLQKLAREKGGKTLLDDAGVLDFRAYDYRTFKVTLKAPSPHFLEIVSSVELCPVYSMSSHYEMIPMVPSTVVTNGPYRLTKVDESHVVLSRSRTYWNIANIRINQVICQLNRSWSTGYFGFRSGQVQLVESLPHEMQQDLMLSNDAFRVALNGDMSVLMINPTTEPTNRYNYRKALRLAVDRVNLEDEVLGIGDVMAYKLMNYADFRSSKWFSSEDKDFVRFEEISKVENARQLMASSKADTDRMIRILVTEDDQSRRYANAIREMWMNNLGVPVNLSAVPETDFDELMATGKFQAGIVRVRWSDQQSKGLYGLLNRFGSMFGVEYQNRPFADVIQEIDKREWIIPLAYESSKMLIHPQMEGWIYDDWGNWYFGNAKFNLVEE